MKSDKLLIVNSDDFGLSDSVNDAILRSFENGWISSTTMMASMPGFGNAVELANTKPVLKNAIGLHMNLTEGFPLTDPIKKCVRFSKEGRFNTDRKKNIFQLTPDEKTALYTEMKAQLSRLVDNKIIPTHLDSHHHVHTEFGVTNVYLAVAKEFGIRKVRISKNIGSASPIKKLYKSFYKYYVRTRFSAVTTDVFCSANEYATIMNDPAYANQNIEVMVHSMIAPGNLVVDIDKIGMEEKMVPLLKGKEIKSYYSL